MIEITVNGKKLSIAEGTTVATLVESLGVSGRRVAVELDGMVVPRSAHPTSELKAGTKVEVVHAIGGG